MGRLLTAIGDMKQKHVPMRTCLGCHQIRPKRSMIRIVRTPDHGVVVDPTGKRAGRGGYLCPQASCWEMAIARGHLERGLETTLSPEEKASLRDYAKTFESQGDRTIETSPKTGDQRSVEGAGLT